MGRNHLSAFVTGAIFGIGLLLSGMANPARVLGFLDLAGDWDPTLALVMAGAVAMAALAFTVARGRPHSLLGEPIRIPPRGTLDRRLVLGSLGFGIGWGLVGFCPGPALVAAGALVPQALVFVAAMVAGMALFELVERRRG